jgi:dolichyl-phosphate-mannose--protein O-mannosyl transferase
MAERKSNTLPLILLAVSLASIVATAVLLLSGFYFFFFFIPFAFGLPWSVKKLRENQRRRNVEDLR